MRRRPPRSTRTDPRFPYTTLVRSYQEYACRTTRSARSLRAGSSRAGAARAAREPESVTDTEAQPLAWSELLGRRFRLATVTLGLSIILHAVNFFVFATLAPSVVADLGGLERLHWATTLYVVASLVSSAAAGQIRARPGARRGLNWAVLARPEGSRGGQ